MFSHPGPDIIFLYSGQSLGCGGMGYLLVAAINDLLSINLQKEKSHAEWVTFVCWCKGVQENIFYPVSGLSFFDLIFKFLCLVVGKLLRVNIISFPSIRGLNGRGEFYHRLYGCNLREHVSPNIQLSWVIENRSSILCYLYCPSLEFSVFDFTLEETFQWLVVCMYLKICTPKIWMEFL